VRAAFFEREIFAEDQVTGAKALARCSTATRRQTMAACLDGGEVATIFLCSILSFQSLLKRFPRTYQCLYVMCISLSLARSLARSPLSARATAIMTPLRPVFVQQNRMAVPCTMPEVVCWRYLD